MVERATDYAIFTFDPEGRVTTWNAGAEEILGYAEEEILGRDSRIIFTPEDRERGSPADIARRPPRPRAGPGRALARPEGRRAVLGQGLVMPLKDDADGLAAS